MIDVILHTISSTFVSVVIAVPIVSTVVCLRLVRDMADMA